jgi:hypothetical protein
MINPPPADQRCQCCGRHIQELPSFSDRYGNDWFIGDPAEEHLVKKHRELYGLVIPSWECVDCDLLSLEEYLATYRRFYQEVNPCQS